MATIRLSGDASGIRRHQQTARRDTGHQVIGALTVRDPTFDPSSTDCQETMATSFSYVQPDNETEQQSRGNATDNNLLQQLPSIGVTVDEQNLDAIHLDPRQTQENLNTSMSQSDSKDHNSRKTKNRNYWIRYKLEMKIIDHTNRTVL